MIVINAITTARIMLISSRTCAELSLRNRYDSSAAPTAAPCLEAARTLTAVRAVVGEHRDEWQEFEASAAEHGICAYLSVPVVLPASERSEAQHMGSLNIYNRTAAAFDRSTKA